MNYLICEPCRLRLSQAKRNPAQSHRGSILLTVLVVVVMLTLTGMAYYNWSYVEYRSSEVAQRQLQTRLAAESGIEFLRYMLKQDDAWLAAEGGLSNNPSRMRVILTGADGQIPLQAALRCRYSVVAPLIDSYGEFNGARLGVEDESARLNLNTLLVADARDPEAAIGRNLLLSLPGMTESIADAILDFIDDDDDPREFGAERSYYSSLTPGYEPQNGPLESIDQLLLVRDVTPELLYGFDRNRNFQVDPTEQQVYELLNVDNTTGNMNRGWAAYLTLRSGERNLRADGTPKIDVNSEDLEALQEQLLEVFDVEQANFIIAYRQGGPYEEDEPGGNELIKSANGLQFDFDAGGSVPINSILDLVGVKTRVVEQGQTDRTIVETPFPDEPGAMGVFLPLMMENLTSNPQEVIPGRLNVNQAPRALLEGLSRALPEALPPSAAEIILANRSFEPRIDRPEQEFETWLLTTGVVTLEEMKLLMPLVTAGGDIYRAQVVGYYEAEGPFSRFEATIDATGDEPKVTSISDLTPLGAGFNAAQLGTRRSPTFRVARIHSP